MRLRLLGGGAAAAIGGVIVVACAGLKQGAAADGDQQSTDASSESSTGSSDDDASVPGDDASGDPFPDAGDPPQDFACGAWNSGAPKPECAARTVKDVSAAAPLDPTGVSIARTPAGRVGIVFNSEDGAESGEMWLAHFKPTTATYPAPTIIRRAGGFALHDGYTTKISASAPDSLHVLAHDVEDDSRSGEVRLYSLVNGLEPLTNAQLVVAGVAHPTELALAFDPKTGAGYATVRVSTGTNAARLASRVRAAAGASTWVDRPDLTTLLQPRDAPGSGGTSLFVDPVGSVHLLYHHNESALLSSPRYHSLDGTTWSSTKTIDNNSPNGLSGFSGRIAAVGNRKYAVYFYRKGGQTPATATADLRLATWQSSADTPAIEILDQNIPSPVALSPQYGVAMAIDKYGLLHLAVIRPVSPNNGHLDYVRQTRTAGVTKWLSDTIDPDVLSDLSDAYVDLVIDENARPHIAYRSAKDGRVKYATRYDR